MMDGQFPKTGFYLKKGGAEASERVGTRLGFPDRGTVTWGQTVPWGLSCALCSVRQHTWPPRPGCQ